MSGNFNFIPSHTHTVCHTFEWKANGWAINDCRKCYLIGIIAGMAAMAMSLSSECCDNVTQ
jgi:hypothetical protein